MIIQKGYEAVTVSDPNPYYAYGPIRETRNTSVYGNSLVEQALYSPRTAADENFSGLDAIMNGKSELLCSKIELILMQIEERKTISKRILDGIDYDSCQVHSIAHSLGDHAYLMSRERMKLEQMRFDLEKQRRMEESSLFRDTARLNTELKDALIEYQQEKQAQRIMEDL